MVKYCCASGCKEYFVKGTSITFHSFPKEEKRRIEWQQLLRRENFKATDASRICSKHFDKNCFDRTKYGGTWLKPDAKPTIFNCPPRLLHPKARRKSQKKKVEDSQPSTSTASATSLKKCKTLHYIGDFSEEDIKSLSKARKALFVVKKDRLGEKKKLRSLKKERELLEKRVANLQEVLKEIKKKTLISDSANDVLKKNETMISQQTNNCMESEGERDLHYVLDFVVEENEHEKDSNSVESNNKHKLLSNEKSSECLVQAKNVTTFSSIQKNGTMISPQANNLIKSEGERDLDYFLDFVVEANEHGKDSNSVESNNKHKLLSNEKSSECLEQADVTTFSTIKVSETSEDNEDKKHSDILCNSTISEVPQEQFQLLIDPKIIKIEPVSPEPCETTMSTREPGCLPPSNNWEGIHKFSITVSYFDSRKTTNCAIYSEPKNKLYISKDYEFQVLCKATNVPSGSVLRATIFFTSYVHSSEVVKRCPVHIQEDTVNGKPAAEHVIQSLHYGAVYERNEQSGRYSVVVPYQYTQGPYSYVQGSAELSCYTYKFTCWSSCCGINRRHFIVHFTLENNDVLLGRQTLGVRVCACPVRDFNVDATRQNQLAESCLTEETCDVDNPNQSTEEYVITTEDYNLYRFLEEMKVLFQTSSSIHLLDVDG